MVHVQVFEDGQGRLVGFEIQGHAGFAWRGKDIVCAAVSMLAHTALLGLKHYLPVLPQVEKREGYLYCVVPGEIGETVRERAEIVLRTIYLGFLALEEEYGNYVRVKVRRYNGPCGN